jgi:hypothetical protein
LASAHLTFSNQQSVSKPKQAVKRCQCSYTLFFFIWPVVSFFVRRRQFLLVRIDDEHGQQLSGFGLARVLTNAVPVARHLGPALSGAISDGRPIIDRTSDRAFENGCIDESRLGMRVGRGRTAVAIFDEHTLDALARHIGQSVLVNERDLWILVSGYPEFTPIVATMSAQTISVKRGSPTGFEVRIRFIVISFSYVVWLFS